MLENVLWYSRYSVWVGAIILLVQSITGRSVGILTLVGVLLLVCGFISFLAALSWQGFPDRWRTALVTAPVSARDVEPLPPADEAVQARAAHAPAAPLELVEEVRPPEPEPLPKPANAPVEATPHPAPQVRQRIPTMRLSESSPAIEAGCPGCERTLRAGQLVVACPVCATVQHASCWTDNGFACSVDGCTGRGSLEAPDD
jgi:hypothetical protein